MRVSQADALSKLTLVIALVGQSLATAASARDSVPPPPSGLEEIVVVGDRTEGRIRESTWATSVLRRDMIVRFPARNLTDALTLLPGSLFLERDGTGRTPMAISRGFYGGGETEYALLSVDGMPLNDVRTGLIEWSELPLQEVERVEVLRGGGSTVYGDQAMGAVVNVVTRAESGEDGFRARAFFGDYGERAVAGYFRGSSGANTVYASGLGERSDGYRSHSNWENVRIGGRYARKPDDGVAFQVRGNLLRVENEEPGPLTEAQIAVDRRQVNPLFEADYRNRDRAELAVTALPWDDARRRLSLDLGFRASAQEQVRTLPLTPSFGDTQFRDENARSTWANAKYEQESGPFRLLTGIDFDLGHFESDYFALDDRSSPLTYGKGDRIRTGLYLEAHARSWERLLLTGGVRYDAIRDAHDSDESSNASQTFDELSPRLGVNAAYLSDPESPGHVYVNWTRAFKAPTLDQLYDRREIPVGPPGVTINISNADLRPQTSNGYEVGVHQGLSLSAADRPLHAAVSASVYRIDLQDEIDFDLATFSYGNILESRHDGFEGSAEVNWNSRVEVRSSVNLLDVSFRSGSNSGNQLKAIPHVGLTNGVHLQLSQALGVGFTHRFMGEAYLDDENTTTLPSFSTVDAIARFEWRRATFRFSVTNLANTLYSSTGFLLFDPASASEEKLLYPAQGRSFAIGIEI
jgi:iron complex outermembrane receptor protein